MRKNESLLVAAGHCNTGSVIYYLLYASSITASKHRHFLKLAGNILSFSVTAQIHLSLTASGTVEYAMLLCCAKYNRREKMCSVSTASVQLAIVRSWSAAIKY